MDQKDQNATLREILSTLKSLQHDHSKFSSAVDGLSARVDRLSVNDSEQKIPVREPKDAPLQIQTSVPATPTQPLKQFSLGEDASGKESKQKQSTTSRIILTTYPGQSGIDPIPMDWGNKEPLRRGPVVVSRHQNTVRRRNGQSDGLFLGFCD